jgi:hypothetical protein
VCVYEEISTNKRAHELRLLSAKRHPQAGRRDQQPGCLPALPACPAETCLPDHTSDTQGPQCYLHPQCSHPLPHAGKSPTRPPLHHPRPTHQTILRVLPITQVTQPAAVLLLLTRTATVGKEHCHLEITQPALLAPTNDCMHPSALWFLSVPRILFGQSGGCEPDSLYSTSWRCVRN